MPSPVRRPESWYGVAAYLRPAIAAFHTHQISSGCNGSRTHNSATYIADAPDARASSNIFTLAGNTATNKAISPYAAHTRVCGISSPIAPAISAIPLQKTAACGLGIHDGTMRKNISGAKKCELPVMQKISAIRRSAPPRVTVATVERPLSGTSPTEGR